ncbi:hypothetical protein PIB30_039854 [Stylosanthes scabra]|uniref:Uncharacterized protein n=1 Tax=Stylosanthes scabra TaxID=79078 RepID=A0ABU6UG69_9FABA|nr:hypothetical protein [Stylosanthes scabra]
MALGLWKLGGGGFFSRSINSSSAMKLASRAGMDRGGSLLLTEFLDLQKLDPLLMHIVVEFCSCQGCGLTSSAMDLESSLLIPYDENDS